MRSRTLFALALTVFALPARAADPPGRESALAVETLVAIADTQLEAALDERTDPRSKDALLDTARAGFQKALRKEPASKLAIREMARFYARVGDRDQAREMYKKYLTLYPDAEVAHEVAFAHARWKDMAGAVAWCELALKIDPENRSVKKTLGFCLACDEKWDEAFAVLLQIMPEAQARHNLAGMLDHKGHTDASMAQLQLALKADPNYAPARALLRELETAVAPMPREAPGVFDQILIAQLLAKHDNEPPQVVAHVTVLQVPRGFIDRAGLNVGGEMGAKSWTLTPRETHMLNELVRGAKGRGECDVLAGPTVQMRDGQTGRVRVGHQYPVMTGFDIKTAGGVATLEPKKEFVEIGVALDLMPHLAPDGKSVRLDTNFRLKQVTGEVKTHLTVTPAGAAFPVTPWSDWFSSDGRPVPVTTSGTMVLATHVVAVPTFTTSAVRETAQVAFGHTLVLVAGSGTPGEDTKVETLVFVTPELAKAQEPLRPAAGWFVK